MHAKKRPSHFPPRNEPDLSHLQTRKVDTVSSLAAEMMLREVDEAATHSSENPTPPSQPAALPIASPFGPPPPFAPPPFPPTPFAPAPLPRPQASSPAWSSLQPAPARADRGAQRVAILVVAGLLLVAFSAFAAFVLTR